MAFVGLNTIAFISIFFLAKRIIKNGFLNHFKFNVGLIKYIMLLFFLEKEKKIKEHSLGIILMEVIIVNLTLLLGSAQVSNIKVQFCLSKGKYLKSGIHDTCQFLAGKKITVPLLKIIALNLV